MQLQNFTSLPPEEEAAFVIYEERALATLKKGKMYGLIAALVFAVAAIGMAATGGSSSHGKSSQPDSSQQQDAESKTAKK